MSQKHFRFPTEFELLLIKAAIFPKPIALKAWRELRNRSLNSNNIRGGTRLLPMIYKNLKTSATHQELEPLKASYEGTLLVNQMKSLNFKFLIKHLENNSIPFLMLKGFALHLLYYKDLGLRPMEDIDFLISGTNTFHAINILLHLGFTTSESMNDYPWPHRHSVGFNNPTGLSLDLHRHVLESMRWVGSDQGFWDHSLEVLFDEQLFRVPSPAHLLLNVCGHALEANWPCNIQWVIDSAKILRGRAVNWDIFIEECQKLRLTLTMKSALQFLTSLDLPVPNHALRDLNTIKVGWVEAFSYRYTSQNDPKGAPFGLWNKIQLRAFRFCYFTKQVNQPVNLRSILRYFRSLLGISQLSDIPGRLGYLWEMVRGSIGSQSQHQS